MTGELFYANVDPVLVKEFSEGDVVVMDNLSGHTQAAVRERLAAAGCGVLSQPPCSPDDDPIERAFSKLKRLRRRAGEGVRSAPGRLLDEPSPQERQHYFRHRGYAAMPS